MPENTPHPLENMPLKRAKEHMKELVVRDRNMRSFLTEADMGESTRMIGNINPTYIYERIEQLVDKAISGSRPDAGEVDRAQAMYRQLMDQLTAFKLAFDDELVRKGADRRMLMDVIISEGAKKRAPMPPNEAWRQTKLGQAQEQAYALISETGQHAGTVARALDIMRQPPGTAAAASIV